MKVRDPLISMFKPAHLKTIIDNSAYHSPEVSETDEENEEGGKRKIVMKELRWRSSRTPPTTKIGHRGKSDFHMKPYLRICLNSIG